ncbi:MAG TPA: isochorismatase family cysteine hydrolase [Gaiellaceae bacterium]|nr:isochorismatase family cysteine hydrolase [Gaiellaceae bacterium]
MRDCLLAVDLFSDFTHEDGDRLLESLRERAAGLTQAVEHARERSLPLIYANDSFGVWNGDSKALVRRALAGPGGDVLAEVTPRDGDAFILKPRYSAFDLTPLELVLSDVDAERILLLGMATEMCVAQTAIDARERGYKVTVITDACVPVDRELEQTALRYLADVTGTWLAASLEEALAVPVPAS